MARAKVAITLDEKTLAHLDHLVQARVFPSHSQAVQEEVAEKLARLEHSRLARECAKLDPVLPRSWRHGPNIERGDSLGRSGG